jgi:hypothetical protein
MSLRLSLCILLFLIFAPLPALAAPTNCVTYLRQRGYYVPRVGPKINAIYLPVESTELPPENRVALIVTRESWRGHVRIAQTRNGKLYNVIDSVNGTKPVEISLKIYKGFVYLK